MLKIEVTNKPVSKEERKRHKEKQKKKLLLKGLETHEDVVAYIQNLEKRIAILEKQSK